MDLIRVILDNMYDDEDHDGEYDALVTRAAEYQRTLEPVLSSPTSSSRNTNHLPKRNSFFLKCVGRIVIPPNPRNLTSGVQKIHHALPA